MTAAALNAPKAPRDPFMPRAAQRTGPALGLALFAHGLLIVALAFGVNWRSAEPTTMAAELWSAIPQAAAPRAVEPPTTAPVEPPKPTPPVVKPPVVVPAPPTPALPDPQIAIEKAKREEAKRLRAEEDAAREKKIEREKAQRAKDELAKAELEKKKAAAEKLKADNAKAESAKAEKAAQADAARLSAARDANLKRMQGLAGATGGPADTGTALQSSGPSASYAGRIMARIKPNIVFSDTVDGNPMATVEVRLAPDGKIIGKRLIKSSGVKSWDEAVLRAIERTEMLPLDIDGRVPPPFQIDFRLRD